MAIEFTYTVQDIREATSAAGKKQKRARTKGLLGWILFVFLATMLFLLRQYAPTAPPAQPAVIPTTQPDEPPAVDPILLLAPQVSIVLFLLGILVVALVNAIGRARAVTATGKDGKPNKLIAFLLSGWMLALVGVNMVYVLDSNRRSLDWHPLPSTELFVSYLPWAALFFFGLLLLVPIGKLNIYKVWAQSKSLHRPKKMEFDDTGFILRDDVAEHHIRWPHLVRYRETENLLILNSEDGPKYIFPKRAFESSEQLMQFRGVIHTNIAEGEFLRRESAFPVSVPVPALPVRTD